MAYQFSVMLSFSSTQLAERCSRLLSRETRPLFDEDVPDEDQSLYQVVSQLEYAGVTTLDERRLLLEWIECDGLGMADLLPLIGFPGITLVLAYEIPDDPLSWDEDVLEGRWWGVENGRVVEVTRQTVLQKYSQLVETLSG